MFDRVEEVRALAKSRPAGDSDGARAAAAASPTAFSLAEARGVVKAFTTYFQLVNLAEEQERVRVLHERAFARARAEGRPIGESVGAAVRAARERRRHCRADAGGAGPPLCAACLHRASDRGEAPHHPGQAATNRRRAGRGWTSRPLTPEEERDALEPGRRGNRCALAVGRDPAAPAKRAGRGAQRPLLLRRGALRPGASALPQPRRCAGRGLPWPRLHRPALSTLWQLDRRRPRR